MKEKIFVKELTVNGLKGRYEIDPCGLFLLTMDIDEIGEELIMDFKMSKLETIHDRISKATNTKIKDVGDLIRELTIQAKLESAEATIAHILVEKYQKKIV